MEIKIYENTADEGIMEGRDECGNFAFFCAECREKLIYGGPVRNSSMCPKCGRVLV